MVLSSDLWRHNVASQQAEGCMWPYTVVSFWSAVHFCWCQAHDAEIMVSLCGLVSLNSLPPEYCWFGDNTLLSSRYPVHDLQDSPLVVFKITLSRYLGQCRWTPRWLHVPNENVTYRASSKGWMVYVWLCSSQGKPWHIDTPFMTSMLPLNSHMSHL